MKDSSIMLYILTTLCSVNVTFAFLQAAIYAVKYHAYQNYVYLDNHPIKCLTN